MNRGLTSIRGHTDCQWTVTVIDKVTGQGCEQGVGPL